MRFRIAAMVTQLATPAAVTWVLFIAVAAAIVFNALFLQTRQHPAPLVGTGDAEERPEQQGDILVLSVQAALKEVGDYSGPLDGLDGPQTQSAIRLFESRAGLTSTGRPTPALLAAVQTFANQLNARRIEERRQSPAGPSEPDSRVTAVQVALARSAYGPLRDDGVVGPETRMAIMRFQRDRNLPVTGEISDDLVAELRTMGALEAE